LREKQRQKGQSRDKKREKEQKRKQEDYNRFWTHKSKVAENLVLTLKERILVFYSFYIFKLNNLKVVHDLYFITNPEVRVIVLPPSTKECNFHISRSQTI